MRRQRSERISSAVTIERDEYGVPHVIAASPEDAFFGFGFAIAQDRLFQMDLLRRTANGRLSEVAGEATLQSDRLMRLLGIRHVTRELVNAASSEAQGMLQAFTSGVNHRVERLPAAVEFRVLRYVPEPWTPEDSMAILRLMAWGLSALHESDLMAERLRATLGDEWTDAIFEGRLADSPVVVREQGGVFRTPRVPESIFPTGGASNAWAVAPERSMTGYALLANDPHLGYTNPSVWCEISLEAPELRVAGVTMPGLPGVAIGRTPTFAWGLTASMITQTSLYREELSADGTSVRDASGDGWNTLAMRAEEIVVKGRGVERFTVRSTPRGPLFSDVTSDSDQAPVSLYWTGMEVSQELDAFLALNRAASVRDAVAARGLAATPPLNMAAADADGNIATISIGRFPIRDSRAGLLSPSEHPPRYIPTDEMPLEINPSRGWIAHANNRIVGASYRHRLHGFYEPYYRIRRISDELESRGKHSIADMRALQLDVHSIHASELAPIIVQLIDGDTSIPRWVLDDLRRWNFEMTTESRAALIFETFYRRWVHQSLRSHLPEHLVDTLVEMLAVGAVPMEFCDRLLRGDYPRWLDDDRRESIVREAVKTSLTWIEERLGANQESWTWGRLHTVTFVHPFGQIDGPHTRFVNVGPFPAPGDRTTVWPSGVRSRELFAVTGGPSMRFVTDLRRPALAWMTNTLGQTGLPFSRHFRDQVNDFLNGRVHPIWGQRRKRRMTILPG